MAGVQGLEAAHRSAVVIPEDLLVEVVEELLLELQHHLPGQSSLSTQGACKGSSPGGPSQGTLTFRSLSDSRNISFTTSLVSAARTVCMVALVQRVCGRTPGNSGHNRGFPGHFPHACPDGGPGYSSQGVRQLWP